MEFKIFKGQELLENGLAEQIIDLDRRNMQSTLYESGIEFPEDKRRRGLESDSTFIIAFDGPKKGGESAGDVNLFKAGARILNLRFRIQPDNRENNESQATK